MEVNYGMVIIYFLWLQRIGAQENYAIGLIVSFLCCRFFSKIRDYGLNFTKNKCQV
jgi:hypothetical protein